MNPCYKTTRNSRYVWQKDYILVKGNAAFEYAETLANHEIEKERTFQSNQTKIWQVQILANFLRRI